MAGINRLGKGAAKPGTTRPQDPNRFKTEDYFSVDAEQDPEYLRRVVEVEQLANSKTGCILAKGAFDKNDQLYLRDEAERARHAELELRDAQLAKFSRLRDAIGTGASSGSGGGPGDPEDVEAERTQGAGASGTAAAATDGGRGGGPPFKRSRAAASARLQVALQASPPRFSEAERARRAWRDTDSQVTNGANGTEPLPQGSSSSIRRLDRSEPRRASHPLMGAGLGLGYASESGEDEESVED